MFTKMIMALLNFNSFILSILNPLSHFPKEFILPSYFPPGLDFEAWILLYLESDRLSFTIFMSTYHLFDILCF